MKTRTRLAFVASGCAVLFFFFVPVIKMDQMPCFLTGPGYSSLSYHFFNYGLAYITPPDSMVLWGPMPQSWLSCI